MSFLIDKMADAYLGPTDTGLNAIFSLSLSGAAGLFDLDGNWGGVTKRFSTLGKWMYVTIGAEGGGDVQIRFRAAGTSSPGTTITNGITIYSGTRESFLVTPAFNVVDAFGTATLKGWVSSPTG